MKIIIAMTLLLAVIATGCSSPADGTDSNASKPADNTSNTASNESSEDLGDLMLVSLKMPGMT